MVRRPQRADYDLVGYTREAGNEIKQLFPRLSNPTLVLYVYPHLAGAERHPVPGYSTAFTFYEKLSMPCRAKSRRDINAIQNFQEKGRSGYIG